MASHVDSRRGHRKEVGILHLAGRPGGGAAPPPRVAHFGGRKQRVQLDPGGEGQGAPAGRGVDNGDRGDEVPALAGVGRCSVQQRWVGVKVVGAADEAHLAVEPELKHGVCG